MWKYTFRMLLNDKNLTLKSLCKSEVHFENVFPRLTTRHTLLKFFDNLKLAFDRGQPLLTNSNLRKLIWAEGNRIESSVYNRLNWPERVILGQKYWYSDALTKKLANDIWIKDYFRLLLKLFQRIWRLVTESRGTQHS